MMEKREVIRAVDEGSLYRQLAVRNTSMVPGVWHHMRIGAYVIPWGPPCSRLLDVTALQRPSFERTEASDVERSASSPFGRV